MRRAQFAAGTHMVETLTFGKTAHLYRALPAVAHGFHAEVQIRGEAPVEAQLLVAKMPSPRGRAVVEEGQGDRLLQLPGKGPGEQQPGDVGFDDFGAKAGAEILEPVGEEG